jgi:hypothetical protein
MKDRVSSKVLDNGAIRYGVYDESGTLEKYQYLKLEDEPVEEGSALNKANLLPDSVCERFALSSDAEIKDAFNAVFLPRLTVDIGVLEELTLTVTKDDYTITASSNGEQYIVFELPSYGVWTISDGTVNVDYTIDSVSSSTYIWTGSGALDNTSWSVISALSKKGVAENYFAVGDCKKVELNGTVGTLELSNEELYVYILGFNHNSVYEGTGIHFSGFKTAAVDGVDVCLVDGYYGVSGTAATTGKKYFNLNHWSNSIDGGWAGLDARYDILGSTDVAPSGYGSSPTSSRVGYNATIECAKNPVENTLMAALPSDLRSVMQPIVKYSNNVGLSNVQSSVSATVDYLPLPAEFEIFGERKNANIYEQNYQKQYDYFALGNSRIRYKHTGAETSAVWGTRSVYASGTSTVCAVSTGGNNYSNFASSPKGLSPIFKV